jgi:hypothetical protein
VCDILTSAVVGITYLLCTIMDLASGELAWQGVHRRLTSLLAEQANYIDELETDLQTALASSFTELRE